MRQTSLLKTPDSLVEEHEEIFGEFRRFAKWNDRTGDAIRQLLRVLEPHFEKEEEVAMPLLGALAPLSSGKPPARGAARKTTDEILSLHSKLLKEMPSMLAEHKKIHDRILHAKEEATKENHNDVIEMLEALEHHAKVEEEVLYPAAILTGVAAKGLTKEGGIQP